MTEHYYRPLAIASALLLPQIGSATVLVGFHDFDGVRNEEIHDVAAPGFTGKVIDGAPERSFDVGGSNDGTYGPSIPVGTANNDKDGYLRSISNDVPLTKGNPIIEISYNPAPFSGSPPFWVLDTLVFDGAKQQGPVNGTIAVWYNLNGANGGAFTQFSPSLISPTDAVGTPYAGNAGTSSDYHDYVVDLSGFTLFSGDVIRFLFDMDPDGRLDNIALTSIPETSGVVALGGLLGGGLLLRKRRRFRSAK